MKLPESKLIKNQKIKKHAEYTEDGIKCRITATIRHDDQCGNGHNSFSITGDIHEYRNGRWIDAGGGCIHDEIAKHFPELKPFIKWHLTSTDGPMYYIANTMFHASDKDCHGLRKGEVKQIVNGRTGKPCWTLEGRDKDLPQYVDSDKCPKTTALLKYVPFTRTGEGSEPNLEAARRCAVWPEANLEDFTKEALEARLPALMLEFKRDVESLGLEY